jgi:hypothetical protein
VSQDGGPRCRVPQPPRRNPRRVSHATGLGSIRFRSPLLTESLLFSLPPGTEMFHFPGFPPPALYIQAGVTPHNGCRVPPFGHPRINARLTAPRGLSRPPTSFIGSWYQGIHRAPLITYTPGRPQHFAGRPRATTLGTTIKALQQKPDPQDPHRASGTRNPHSDHHTPGPRKGGQVAAV